MTHLKSLSAPRSWPIKRKERVWISRFRPGPHSSKLSIPLLVLLRDVIHVVDTKKEAKYLVNEQLVKVNNHKVSDVKLSVGLFDVVSIDKENKYYRIIINKKNRIFPIEIPKKESTLIPLKISNKKILGKNKTQLNFTNGWNLNVKKDKYSCNDTVIYDLSENKIKDCITLDKGNTVFILKGKHVGTTAKIKDIKEKIILESGKKSWIGILDYVFVIGKKSPVIKISEEK